MAAHTQNQLVRAWAGGFAAVVYNVSNDAQTNFVRPYLDDWEDKLHGTATQQFELTNVGVFMAMFWNDSDLAPPLTVCKCVVLAQQDPVVAGYIL